MEKILLDLITGAFVESSDFNGISGTRLLTEVGGKNETLISILEGLLLNNKIVIAFDSFQGNPHILRVQPPDTLKQIEFLKSEPPRSFCVYPSVQHLKGSGLIDHSIEAPYTRNLAEGKPQLTPIFFELDVLENYYRDPRYHFEFHDRGGSISIRGGEIHDRSPERDRIFLQTFGIAYSTENEEKNRMVGVYLRYLSDLSPEHQRVWAAKEVTSNCRLNGDYDRATLYGTFPRNHSAYEAFVQNQVEVNKLSVLIGKPFLFRKTFSEGRPEGFFPMFRPTSLNYSAFVQLLDKMLGDNIDREFFRGDVPLEEEIHRKDGRIEISPKGSLSLLREWVSKKYKTKDKRDASDEVVGPMKKIRKLRQAPAHKISENIYDLTLPKKQDELLKEAFSSLQVLRYILMAHPRAKGYNPPGWLDGDRIVIY